MKKEIKNSKFGLEKFTILKLKNMIEIKGGSDVNGGGHDTDRTGILNGPPPPPITN